MEIREFVNDSVALLKEMVATPSPSFGEDEVRGIVDGFLTSVGIGHIVMHNNILAFNRRFSPDKRTLMLCAHLDTVPPADDYDFDPYCPDYEKVKKVLFGAGEDSEAEEVVAGLGSNDDGASVVSMIAVMRHFHDADLPVNLLLVLSGEEERSGKSGMDLVWKVMRESGVGPVDYPPDWAIVGEPTGMRAAVAEKGLLVIDAMATGISGHAARDEGVNAIYIAMADIDRLRGIQFDRKSSLMGDIRITVTQINAGTAHNVVPDKCSFVADIRPNEQYTNAEILSILQAQCRSELRARNLGNRSSATRADSPLLRAAEASGVATFVSPTTSDWMRIDCDAVKMGPGQSSRSHHKNEYVRVDEIRDGIGAYIRFIENFIKTIG